MSVVIVCACVRAIVVCTQVFVREYILIYVIECVRVSRESTLEVLRGECALYKEMM